MNCCTMTKDGLVCHFGPAPPFTAETYLYATRAKRKDVLGLTTPGAAYYRRWSIHRYLYFKRVYFAFRNGIEAAKIEADTWESPAETVSDREARLLAMG